ncbi:Zf-FLZ domain containing protein [Trema orientale]|uniref:Zf-FLZ domain containing protein n=1 Tax=Trema orientale TaxID=63057 RepID=A0A2P5FAX3_TREOI|nr:Zf-FLZ domain containing protein [Trema orientale]
MRVKRSRIRRSPSYGGAGALLSQIGPPAAEPTVLRFDSHSAPSISAAGGGVLKQSAVATAAETANSGSAMAILAVSSPDAVMEDGDWQSGGGDNFLDRCFRCKKRIGNDDEVFMFRHLRAFCTPYCRAEVINKDDEFKSEFKHFCQTISKSSKKNKRVQT